MHSEPANPAYDCVFNPKYTAKFESSPNVIPPLGIRIRPHLQNADINLGSVCDFSKFPESPPWTFKTPEVCFDLASHRKDSTSSLAYKAFYAELCQKFPSFNKIFTDGSKSDEGVAASAFCSTAPLKPSTKHISSDSSVYTAELTALVLALKMISKSQHKNFLIFSDSLSALEAIAGRNLNHPQLLKFFELFTDLKADDYNIVLVWVPGHVGIRGNETADSMAKNATKEKMSRSYVPYTDVYPKVDRYVRNLWQEEWNKQADNKLFQVRPDLTQFLPSLSGNRKEETVLCRLHTGHTFITHSYLLKGEEPPWCVPCHQPLTVKHLLIDCWDLHDVRHKHYTADSLRTLFRDVPPWTIMEFLREVNVFNKI